MLEADKDFILCFAGQNNGTIMESYRNILKRGGQANGVACSHKTYGSVTEVRQARLLKSHHLTS